MFQVLTLLGVAIFRTFFGEPQYMDHQRFQTSSQVLPKAIPPPLTQEESTPLPTSPTPKAEKAKPPRLPMVKPEVLFGEPLTDEEWLWIQSSDWSLLN